MCNKCGATSTSARSIVNVPVDFLKRPTVQASEKNKGGNPQLNYFATIPDMILEFGLKNTNE